MSKPNPSDRRLLRILRAYRRLTRPTRWLFPGRDGERPLEADRSARRLPFGSNRGRSEQACDHQTVQRCVERADRDRAESRRSRRRPRPGWYLWPATRPRSTAIRMNCGRHGFWPAMRASADRRRVTNVSPVWLKAQCASFSVKRKSSRTRCATIWNAATPSSSPRWRKFCVSTARSRS